MAPISLVQDQSLGLERFKEASVVGTMRVPSGEVGVGSDVTLELEFANVGKTAATLMKLENIFAEGLELDAPKSQLRVEGNFVDLKGKRLEYLKTHDLKIPLKARRMGSYSLGLYCSSLFFASLQDRKGAILLSGQLLEK